MYGQTGVPGSVDVGLVAGDMGDNLPAVPLGFSEIKVEMTVELEALSVHSGSSHNCAILVGGRVKVRIVFVCVCVCVCIF